MSSKILDVVKPGVLFGDDVRKVFEIAKANQWAMPAVNVCLLYTSPSPRD